VTTCTLISVLKLIMMWQLRETSVFCCSFHYNAVQAVAPNYRVIMMIQLITFNTPNTYTVYYLAYIRWTCDKVWIRHPFVTWLTKLHCLSKNDTDVAHYNFNAHQPIFVICGSTAGITCWQTHTRFYICWTVWPSSHMYWVNVCGAVKCGYLQHSSLW